LRQPFYNEGDQLIEIGTGDIRWVTDSDVVIVISGKWRGAYSVGEIRFD
jgi:hypothetical protein